MLTKGGEAAGLAVVGVGVWEPQGPGEATMTAGRSSASGIEAGRRRGCCSARLQSLEYSFLEMNSLQRRLLVAFVAARCCWVAAS